MKQIFNLLSFIFVVFIANCKNDGVKNSHENSDKQEIDDYTAKIDSLIQSTSPRSFNGVILITKNGKTKYSRAFGYSNFEDKIPLKINDNFRIQSNSKQVTAVLLLEEVENGKIDLDSPINKYLPEIKQPWASKVTVHQLLNFTSGIKEIDEPLVFEPGTDFSYNIIAYSLLGDIIENVTGKSYIELANNLFKKLEMHNTFVYELGQTKNKLIQGYSSTTTKNKYKIVDFYNLGITKKWWKDFIPAAGIISNVSDLNIWDTKLHKGNILNPKIYNHMITYNITNAHEAFGPEKIGYGYGVRIRDKHPKYIGHSGKGLGTASIKLYFPEKDVNLIVLENIYHEDNNIAYYHELKLKEIVMNSSLLK